ncbi:Putative Rodlet peptide (Fragment) [Aspergillus calidoustus]|uniref:Hydrophobin n=1 Tax=Aspergillus calidoustus TaxID=454130 RepID=A0A0U5C6U9_ASPCI
MKFSIAAAIVAFAASVAALLPPMPSSLATVLATRASDKCGDQAQLSCCNKATYAGDTTEVADGILAGALSNLIGAGSGAEGLGLFDQCSKLDVALLIGVQDLINQQCKQNIACCQNSGSSADGDLIGVGLPCIALGSIL